MNARVDPRQQDAFLADLRTEKGMDLPKTSAPAPVAAPPPARALPADAIILGSTDTPHSVIGLLPKKLIEGRLLIQGTSGAGKSWTLRRLLEQSARQIQQIIIDPEGEFRSLADEFGHIVLDAGKLDSSALAIAARRAREHRLDVVLDLSEIDREAQMVAAAAFTVALIESPREHWTPAIVAIDEAHLFAPFGGAASESPSIRKASIAAVTDLMSRGRKRGLAGVLATQRIARMSKSVISEAHSFLIGLNMLDLDIRRAAETIGWDARRAFDRLPMLDPGEFVAVGPAFSQSPCVVRVGAVSTRHRGATPEITTPAAMTLDQAARLIDVAALEEATARDAEIRGDATPVGARALRAFICDPSFPLAAALYDAIRPLAPEGALITDLVEHLSSTRDAIAAAIALLDAVAAVDLMGEGSAQAVRLGKGMR